MQWVGYRCAFTGVVIASVYFHTELQEFIDEEGEWWVGCRCAFTGVVIAPVYFHTELQKFIDEEGEWWVGYSCVFTGVVIASVYFHTELQEFIDEEGVRWVREKKRPPIALLSHYQCSWKPKNNHFLRHTDVKPKGQSAFYISTIDYKDWKCAVNENLPLVLCRLVVHSMD